MTQTLAPTLYEQDFNLWLEDTVTRLKSRDFDNLDMENLIEEIESLGKSDRQKVRSYLRQLLIHLLKRCYVASSQDYYHWEIEIDNFRTELRDIFLDSPSLKRFALEQLPNCWEDAQKTVKKFYPQTDIPEAYPFSRDIDALLTVDFWL